MQGHKVGPPHHMSCACHGAKSRCFCISYNVLKSLQEARLFGIRRNTLILCIISVMRPTRSYTGPPAAAPLPTTIPRRRYRVCQIQNFCHKNILLQYHRVDSDIRASSHPLQYSISPIAKPFYYTQVELCIVKTLGRLIGSALVGGLDLYHVTNRKS